MPSPARPRSATTREVVDVADRLHSVAIHMLRRMRRVDAGSRLSGPRLSALSVLVFRGPATPSALAEAEQVKRPTMTRLLQGLEREGYVVRAPDPLDRRVSRVTATPKGVRVMREGRMRRVRMLADLLLELGEGDLVTVRRAVDLLEEVIAGRRTPAAR